MFSFRETCLGRSRRRARVSESRRRRRFNSRRRTFSAALTRVRENARAPTILATTFFPSLFFSNTRARAHTHILWRRCDHGNSHRGQNTFAGLSSRGIAKKTASNSPYYFPTPPPPPPLFFFPSPLHRYKAQRRAAELARVASATAAAAVNVHGTSRARGRPVLN